MSTPCSRASSAASARIPRGATIRHFNIVVTTESFIVTKSLAWLLAFVPIHGVLYLVCLYEPRFFDLLQLWGRTRLPAMLGGNVRFWRANSYSPLALDLPDWRGHRRMRMPPVTMA